MLCFRLHCGFIEETLLGFPHSFTLFLSCHSSEESAVRSFQAALRTDGALNRITSNGAVKILHGSHEDIWWL